jgi:Domain of unknown function (DUF4388)
MATSKQSIFAGELGLVGLFDLTQLLMMNRATGCLAVSSEGRSGQLTFRHGRVINALDETLHEGEAAAYRVYAWRNGTFEFRPEAANGDPAIHVATESLMLEAARRMDEAAPEESAEGGGVIAQLRDRHDAMEALRDAFANIATESRVIDLHAGTPVAAPYLDALTAAGDRLVLRPGRPARLRKAGVWSEAAEPPLAPAEHRRLAAMLRTGRGSETVGAPVFLAIPGGRTLELTAPGASGSEALWLRPVDLSPPDPDKLSGPLEKLEEILELQTGLVLAAGPDIETTRALLHMLVELRAARSGECMLLAANDRTYRHEEYDGVLAQAPLDDIAGAVDAIRPESIVLDATGIGGRIPFECISSVPLVLAGLLAPEPAAMLPRWLARAAGGDPLRAASQLAGTPVALLMVQGSGPEDRLRFGAWILTEAEQAMAMRGAIPELALSLEKQGAFQRRLRLHRA